MKNKIFLLSLIFFASAGCNLLASGAVGVIKTVDGGGVWKASNRIANSKSGDISGISISEMTFDPNNHEHIYASSNTDGLWKSEDSGNSWTQILSRIDAYDFYLNPQDVNNIIVVGIYGEHGKMIRTKDGGVTWDEIYNEASTNNPVTSITANPNNPSEVYAVLNSGVSIKSVDGGTNWFVLTDAKAQVLRIRYSRINNTLYSLMSGRGLFKSTDGGLHWTSLTLILTGTDQGSFLAQYVDRFYKMGLDDQSAGIIYLTTSKGLYKTTNEGQSWNKINLPIQKDSQPPRAIASTHGGVIAYTSIGSTIYKTLNGGESWQTQEIPSPNLVNKIIIDPALPQITYAGLTAR